MFYLERWSGICEILWYKWFYGKIYDVFLVLVVKLLLCYGMFICWWVIF